MLLFKHTHHSHTDNFIEVGCNKCCLYEGFKKVTCNLTHCPCTFSPSSKGSVLTTWYVYFIYFYLCRYTNTHIIIYVRSKEGRFSDSMWDNIISKDFITTPHGIIYTIFFLSWLIYHRNPSKSTAIYLSYYLLLEIQIDHDISAS